ncbi:type II toxin-antitoxin system VapC family toxin [Saccharomonospora iraqiensis]|uniref:type II toxin-antitoxin system VapC family toxin n=1 Tax=Saccharomonospora iraqiensis TaxID=52698 RepID=UPI00047E4AE2|nr:PIN domain-containing protein [Saccharomonospora iraqiensis]
MIVVADTSALFAGFDAGQSEHGEALTVMETETLAISPLVLTELDFLVHRRAHFDLALRATESLLERIGEGQYKLAELRHADLVAAHEVRLKYDALRLDMADAVGVVLAHRYNTNRIFTLDHRDFRAVTPLSAQFDAFSIVPADSA